jgi:hypothetical protein
MDNEEDQGAINFLNWLHVKVTPETIEATKKAHNDFFNTETDVFKQIDDNLQFFEISYVENPPDPKCIIKKYV